MQPLLSKANGSCLTWFYCIIHCVCHRYACTPVSLVCLHCMAHHTHTCTYFPGHWRWGRWLPGQQLERCLYQPSCFLPRRQYQWTQSISTAVDPAKGKISCIGWRTKSELWLSSASFIGLVWQVLIPCGGCNGTRKVHCSMSVGSREVYWM